VRPALDLHAKLRSAEDAKGGLVIDLLNRARLANGLVLIDPDQAGICALRVTSRHVYRR
jgi:hypothetical protein